MSKIDKDDLMALRSLKAKASYDLLASEKAVLQSQLADMNYENSLLKVYIKNGMSLDDGLDFKDGTIMKNEEETKKEEVKNDDIQPQSNN